MVLHYLKKLDIYGRKLHFFINNNRAYKTTFGGFLTLTTFSLLIIGLWVLGQDIIFRTQPIVGTEQILYQSRPPMYLTANSMAMSFVLQDYNQITYYLPRYFKYDISNIQVFNSNGTSTSNTYNTVKCRPDHYPQFSEEYFKRAGLANYYCIDNQNFTLMGYWDDVSIKYLKVTLRLCNNITDEGTCAPKEEIYDYMKRNFFTWNIYLQCSVTNNQNYKNPISYYVRDIYKAVKMSSSKNLEVYIKKVSINTDSGILLEDISTNSSLTFDNSDYDDSDSSESGEIVNIYLFTSNQEEVFNRSYIKVQTICAFMGGLAEVFMRVSLVLCYYFSKMKQDCKILNYIFDYDFSEEEEKKMIKNERTFDFSVHQNIFNNLNISKDNTIRTNNFQNQAPSKQDFFNKEKRNTNDLLNKFKHTKQSFRKLKLSYLDILRIVFRINCFDKLLSRKTNLYHTTERLLIEKLDVRNILKKNEEIDKLKFVLFEPSQMAMFEFISNELIRLNDSIKTPINEIKEVIANKAKLAEMVFECRKKFEVSENPIDKKLLLLLDDDLKNSI